MALPSKYGIDKNMNSMEGLSAYENGGAGSGNFGHAGRPGKRGGSSTDAVSVGATFDKDRDNGGRLKEYQTKLREIQKAIKDDKYREEHFYGLSVEQLRKYEEDMKKNIERESTRKDGERGQYAKRKDYKAEQEGVDVRDGYRIGTEFADLERELGNARTNLKMLKKDKETAYTDLAARSRYLDRSSAIARTIAQATSFGPSSKETKKLVKEITKELRDIYDEYVEVGTKKYFDPDLNVER